MFHVDFDQFKNALILALSSSFEPPQEEQEALSKAGKVRMLVLHVFKKLQIKMILPYFKFNKLLDLNQKVNLQA